MYWMIIFKDRLRKATLVYNFLLFFFSEPWMELSHVANSLLFFLYYNLRFIFFFFILFSFIFEIRKSNPSPWKHETVRNIEIARRNKIKIKKKWKMKRFSNIERENVPFLLSDISKEKQILMFESFYCFSSTTTAITFFWSLFRNIFYFL